MTRVTAKTPRRQKKETRAPQSTDPPDWLSLLTSHGTDGRNFFSWLKPSRVALRRVVLLILLLALVAMPVARLLAMPDFRAKLHMTIEIGRP